MTTETDYIVTTGDYIAEWLEDNGVTRTELAQRIGVSKKRIDQLIQGKVPLTLDVRLKLALVTNIPENVWVNYENHYQQSLARQCKDTQTR